MRVKEKVAYIQAHDVKGRMLASISGSRVRFKAHSSMSQTPNSGVVSVYGLQQDEFGSVVSNAKTVRLFAGDEQSSGLIAEGQVVSARVVSGQDGQYLDVVMVDGDDFFSMPVNRSIAAGISLAGLVEELVSLSAGTAGIGQISPKARSIYLPRGVSVIGSPINLIRGVAKQINAAFYMNQGLVYIVCPEEMVGNQIELEEDDLMSAPVRDGFNVQIVHDIKSAIRVGNTVKLPGSSGGGLYRVQGIAVEGDTMHPVWRMAIEGTEQTPEGFAQSAVTDNVWR